MFFFGRTGEKIIIIGDEKHYSRSKEGKETTTLILVICFTFSWKEQVKKFMFNFFSIAGAKEYLNGELESNTHCAVFQRSFGDYGSYESEKFIRFQTKKSFPMVTVIVVVVVVVIVLVLVGVGVYFYSK